MNSTILKNGVTIFNIFMASTFIFWTIGCQSDDELESVNNSSVVACTSELEDFIRNMQSLVSPKPNLEF